MIINNLRESENESLKKKPMKNERNAINWNAH